MSTSSYSRRQQYFSSLHLTFYTISRQHTLSASCIIEQVSLPFTCSTAIDCIEPQVFPPVSGTSKSRLTIPPSQNIHCSPDDTNSGGDDNIFFAFTWASFLRAVPSQSCSWAALLLLLLRLPQFRR